MIEFLCPQGHKIRCPVEQAGRPAKCPRCGVKFRIPDRGAGASQAVGTVNGAAAEGPSPAAESVDSPAVSSGSGISQPRPVAKEPQIEFLCPNGHHLHGPASLQGRPGECPECGSRFRIPTLEELAAASEAEEEAPAENGGEAGQWPGDAGESPDEEPQLTLPFDVAEAITGASSSSSGLSLPADSEGLSLSGQSLAALFATLWAAKGADSRVEVHLSSGGILLPDGYVKDLSGPDYGVLASKEPDDSYTVTIVPWEGVARVILRGITRLPGEIVR